MRDRRVIVAQGHRHGDDEPLAEAIRMREPWEVFGVEHGLLGLAADALSLAVGLSYGDQVPQAPLDVSETGRASGRRARG